METYLNPGLKQAPGYPECVAVLGSGLLELYFSSSAEVQRQLSLATDGTIRPLPESEHATGFYIALREESAARLQTDDEWEKAGTEATNNNFMRTPRCIPDALADARPNLVTWMAQASDEQLAAFLSWNEWSLRPAQAALRERIKHLSAFMLEDVSRLVAEEDLPAQTVAMLEQSLDETDIRIIDSYETPLCIAYCDQSDKVIGVHELTVTGNDEGLYLFVVHEFFHRLVVENDGEDFKHLFGDDPQDSARWFNEAVNDQLSMAAVYGELETIDPYMRPEGIYYSGYRRLLELLDTVLKLGDEPVSMREVACAYLDTAEAKVLREEMLAKIDRSWRPFYPDLDCHIILKIAREYNAAESPEAQAAVVERWLDDMYQKAGVSVWDLTDEMPSEAADMYILLSPIDGADSPGADRF